MLFIILLNVVGFIISCIIYGVTGSWIGFILCGIMLGLIICLKLFCWLLEDHPLFLEAIYLISSIVCASISVALKTIWPIVFCMLSIGFLKGSYAMADADTSWYDTSYFTLDGVLYSVFNQDRSNFICALGVLIFMGLYGLLSLPYGIVKNGFLAFIPTLFFGIRFIRGIIASR